MEEMLRICGSNFFELISEDTSDLVTFSLISKWALQSTQEVVPLLLSNQYPYAQVKDRNPLKYYLTLRRLLPREYNITVNDGLIDVLWRMRKVVTEEFPLRGGPGHTPRVVQGTIRKTFHNALCRVQPKDDPKTLATLTELRFAMAVPSPYELKPGPVPRILALPNHWLQLLIDMEFCPNWSLTLNARFARDLLWLLLSNNCLPNSCWIEDAPDYIIECCGMSPGYKAEYLRDFGGHPSGAD